MRSVEPQLYDLDHVMLVNRNIYRVLANFRDEEYFFWIQCLFKRCSW